MGVGAPPSAKDEVDMAPSSSRVASIKRITVFMKNFLREMAAQTGTTIFFLEEEIRSVRKTRDDKYASVGIPTR